MQAAQQISLQGLDLHNSGNLKFYSWMSVKNIVFHAAFWIIYFIFVLHSYNQAMPEPQSFILKSTINVLVWRIVGVYFIYFTILPNYFVQKKYVQLFFVIILTLCITSAFNIATAHLFVWQKSHSLVFYYQNYVSIVIDSLLPYLLFLSGAIFDKGIQLQKKVHEQEKDFLQSEIQLLKSQMNPHLIFNALNSIHILMNEDKQKAQNVLMNFSDVLRYQLYECNTETIPLRKEVLFIEKYIELEKIRKEESLVVNKNFVVKHQHSIANLMLQPLIENAFKYVSIHQPINQIDIACHTTDDSIVFCITNTIDLSPPTQAHKGIGINNLKRRLSLIYPNQHQIVINHNTKQFSVTLKIIKL
jgi:two-component system, LytTR family, sensor kinase